MILTLRILSLVIPYCITICKCITFLLLPTSVSIHNNFLIISLSIRENTLASKFIEYITTLLINTILTKYSYNLFVVMSKQDHCTEIYRFLYSVE